MSKRVQIRMSTAAVAATLLLTACDIDSCFTDQKKCPPGTSCMPAEGGSWECRPNKKASGLNAATAPLQVDLSRVITTQQQREQSCASVDVPDISIENRSHTE